MRFEDTANTTAIRMKKAAEAAFNRCDAGRLRELMEKAEAYRVRMQTRLYRVRNTRNCTFTHYNDAANASWLVDIIEGLIKKLEEA